MSCCLVLNELLSDHKRHIYLRSEWKTPWSVITSALVPLRKLCICNEDSRKDVIKVKSLRFAVNLASQARKPRHSLSRQVELNIHSMMAKSRLMPHNLHPSHVRAS